MKYIERYSNRAIENFFYFRRRQQNSKKLNGLLPDFPIRKTGSERNKT